MLRLPRDTTPFPKPLGLMALEPSKDGIDYICRLAGLESIIFWDNCMDIEQDTYYCHHEGFAVHAGCSSDCVRFHIRGSDSATLYCYDIVSYAGITVLDLSPCPVCISCPLQKNAELIAVFATQ